MTLKRLQKPLAALLVLLILGGIFVPVHETMAAKQAPTCNIFYINPLDCAEVALRGVVQVFFEIIGSAISLSAFLLQWVLRISTDKSVVGPDYIENIWVFFRDFVNMFFILVLIIMSFGTIFNIKKYTFKDLFPKFLIAALLINFSFVIGVYIIQVSNGISDVILETVGDVSVGLFDGLLIGKLNNEAQGGFGMFSAIAQIIPDTVGLLVYLVFAILILGVFASAAIFAMVRIFVLWFLLILSPVAWFGMTLPSLKKETWDKWWGAFISWNFFLPVYLFFAMFAVYLSQKKREIIKPINFNIEGARQFSDDTIPYIVEIFFKQIGLLDLIFFFFVIFILITGLMAAFKVGKLAGHGVGATMSWAQGVVKRIPIVPYGKGKGVGGLRWGSAAGVESGAKTLWGVAAKKGFLGFGGSERAKREADSIATRLGLKLGYKRTDLAGLGQKTEKSAVDAKVGELKGAIDAGTLKLDDILKEIESGKDLITLGGRINTETIAKYALAADKGKLTADQLKTLAETVGKENPLIMEGIGGSLVKNNFSGWSEEDIQKIVKPAPDGSVFGGDGGNKVRAQAYEWLASEEGKRRMGSAVDGGGNARVDVEVMKSAVLTMGHNSTEGRKHMRDMATIRPELVVEYRTNVQVQRKNGIEKFYVDGKEFDTRAEADVELATRQAPGGDLTKEKVWKDILETKSGKEIAEFSDITWKIPEFKQELDKRILDMQERGKAKGTNVGTGVQFRQDLMTGLRNNPKYSEKLTEFLRPNSAGYDPTALVSEFASLRAKQSRMKERNISDTAQAMVDLRTDLASVISRMRAAKLNSDLYAE